MSKRTRNHGPRNYMLSEIRFVCTTTLLHIQPRKLVNVSIKRISKTFVWRSSWLKNIWTISHLPERKFLQLHLQIRRTAGAETRDVYLTELKKLALWQVGKCSQRADVQKHRQDEHTLIVYWLLFANTYYLYWTIVALNIQSTSLLTYIENIL